MINTHWLRTFCTLAEIGHFTRAAERLHMTQSGVSQHLSKLEAQLGVELIERQGKQFRLSDAGQKLHRQSRSILEALANLQQEISEDPPYQGRVSLMSPGSVGLKLYPYLLALQKEHPELVIEYRFAPNQDIEDAIAESRTDIGLMSIASTHADLSCTAIADEALLLVSPAAVTRPDWSTLEELGFIDHPDGAHHAQLLLGANYPEFEHADKLKKQGFCNQIGLILEPVAMGLGFTVLPAYAVEAFAQPERINVHQLARPVHETLYLCVLANRTLPRRVDTLIAHTRRRF